MTEDELRSAVSRSQRAGFKALFQQYQSYVYSIVWSRIRTVGTAEDAEECVSDVFADVFLHFDGIPPGSLKSYIATAAHRNAIDRFRRLTAHPETSDDELPEAVSPEDIQGDLEATEQNRRLYERIKSLGEPDATILIQKYYYDRKSGDIARSVNMTAGAVRVRLNRALKRLKKLLKDEDIT